ncbi:MAG: cupin domain-containing protein [bacterium]|nr:cupin domain-containing protein [bacterium]
MPFYRFSEMKKKDSDVAVGQMQSVPGELMKVGVMTFPEGKGPPAHFHPNEEQYVLVLEGKVRMIVGEEEETVEKGHIVHLPRGVVHAMRILEGPAVFFTAKSPAGDGGLTQDYREVDGGDAYERRLDSAAGK